MSFSRAFSHCRSSFGQKTKREIERIKRRKDVGRMSENTWKDVPMDLIQKAFLQAVDYVVRKFDNRGKWYSVGLLVSLIEREEVSNPHLILILLT